MSEADKIIKNLKNSGKKVEEFYVSNKTSDKNVGSMEDDIKILENMIEEYENCSVPEIDMQVNITFRERQADAIQNILSNYRRQKEMNEEHQKINGKLRERVKELEEEKAMLKKASNIAKEVNIEDATEVMNKSYEEFMNDYIPKQAVKDVFQNNRNELFGMTYLSKEQFRPYEMQIERINKIEQELIGEDK